MAVEHLAQGKISPIIYFINEAGYAHILPSDDLSRRFRKHMRKMGFEMMIAETLPQAKKLQEKLQNQLQAEQQAELYRDNLMTSARRAQIKSRLTARLNSSNTSEYEKDFIRMWLEMREKKREIFEKKFTSQIGHLDALEFDNPIQHTHSVLDKL